MNFFLIPVSTTTSIHMAPKPHQNCVLHVLIINNLVQQQPSYQGLYC